MSSEQPDDSLQAIAQELRSSQVEQQVEPSDRVVDDSIGDSIERAVADGAKQDVRDSETGQAGTD